MMEVKEGGESRSGWWYVCNLAQDRVTIYAPGLLSPVSEWVGPCALTIAARTVEALNRMEAAA